jgi:hypothetical protein
MSTTELSKSTALRDATGMPREICDKIVAMARSQYEYERSVNMVSLLDRVHKDEPCHYCELSPCITYMLDNVCSYKKRYMPNVVRYPISNRVYQEFKRGEPFTLWREGGHRSWYVHSRFSYFVPSIVSHSYEEYDIIDGGLLTLMSWCFSPTILIGS